MLKKTNPVIDIILISLLALLLFSANQELIFGNKYLILRPFIKNMFSNICHQDISKIFCYNEHCSYLCSRCEGIYFGAIVSIICLRKLRALNEFFVITSIIMLFDVLSTTFGLYPYTKFFAFITGLFWGSSVILYIRKGLFSLYNELKRE